MRTRGAGLGLADLGACTGEFDVEAEELAGEERKKRKRRIIEKEVRMNGAGERGRVHGSTKDERVGASFGTGPSPQGALAGLCHQRPQETRTGLVTGGFDFVAGA